MRISDWSSDVCSSDRSRKSGQRQRDSLAQCLKHGQREEKRRLLGASPPPARGLRPPRIALRSSHPASPLMSRLRRHAFCWIRDRLKAAPLQRQQRQRHRRNWLSRKVRRIGQRSSREGRGESEGPTCELPSLMRLSIDVFCIKKTNYIHTLT